MKTSLVFTSIFLNSVHFSPLPGIFLMDWITYQKSYMVNEDVHGLYFNLLKIWKHCTALWNLISLLNDGLLKWLRPVKSLMEFTLNFSKVGFRIPPLSLYFTVTYTNRELRHGPSRCPWFTTFSLLYLILLTSSISIWNYSKYTQFKYNLLVFKH